MHKKYRPIYILPMRDSSHIHTKTESKVMRIKIFHANGNRKLVLQYSHETK